MQATRGYASRLLEKHHKTRKTRKNNSGFILFLGFYFVFYQTACGIRPPIACFRKSLDVGGQRLYRLQPSVGLAVAAVLRVVVLVLLDVQSCHNRSFFSLTIHFEQMTHLLSAISCFASSKRVTFILDAS